MTNLEKQFKQALKKAEEEIKKHEDEARVALRNAVEISEKYGIPYSFGISCIRNTYTPQSFDKKWSKLGSDFLMDYDIYVDDAGWHHSAVC